ncbi:DUF5959 family protein [Streptomyces sp. SAS_272]|uniref:DUF5959 family protein n=1 Tax=Streptomyces sp. SAS_272 TaxID=3412747 RepID=UPI00403C9EDB
MDDIAPGELVSLADDEGNSVTVNVLGRNPGWAAGLDAEIVVGTPFVSGRCYPALSAPQRGCAAGRVLQDPYDRAGGRPLQCGQGGRRAAGPGRLGARRGGTGPGRSTRCCASTGSRSCCGMSRTARPATSADAAATVRSQPEPDPTSARPHVIQEHLAELRPGVVVAGADEGGRSARSLALAEAGALRRVRRRMETRTPASAGVSRSRSRSRT